MACSNGFKNHLTLLLLQIAIIHFSCTVSVALSSAPMPWVCPGNMVMYAWPMAVALLSALVPFWMVSFSFPNYLISSLNWVEPKIVSFILLNWAWPIRSSEWLNFCNSSLVPFSLALCVTCKIILIPRKFHCCWLVFFFWVRFASGSSCDGCDQLSFVIADDPLPPQDKFTFGVLAVANAHLRLWSPPNYLDHHPYNGRLCSSYIDL